MRYDVPIIVVLKNCHFPKVVIVVVIIAIEGKKHLPAAKTYKQAGHALRAVL